MGLNARGIKVEEWRGSFPSIQLIKSTVFVCTCVCVCVWHLDHTGREIDVAIVFDDGACTLLLFSETDAEGVGGGGGRGCVSREACSPA